MNFDLDGKRLYLLKLFVARDGIELDPSLLKVIKELPEEELDNDIKFLEEQLRGKIY